MRATVMFALLAASAAMAAGCHRTETNRANDTPADMNASSAPTTPSTTPTTPPALPPTPALPTGAGEASQPGAAATSAPPAGNAPSSAANATNEASPPADGQTGDARDTAANRPTEPMSAGDESAAMPKAGQANNHSSTAMEESRGK